MHKVRECYGESEAVPFKGISSDLRLVRQALLNRPRTRQRDQDVGRLG